ncbi:MvaI/BcnI family restriction endonuclease [Treponema putidum]|uniref:MvaI/BcnI restriction endonuclease family protein n=1 Tax=Treponema putidum TaxID=221027 RepID=A0AAE9MT13_9SPIR|nr:MvaI/BcnI family restriction endonuclease [Treponema putidum]UTY33142.1 MvaI/BcnI restriction endonuclease family protein [Treponema putidum]
MKLFTKETLIKNFIEIERRGWIKNTRKGNQGSVGNTLEDLLGIDENNLPIPNAAEWELKAQRKNTSALPTLFHCEPSPRAVKFVPQILLLNYGWKHKEAGIKYPETEMSFRQTISSKVRSDRGFCVKINRNEKKVLISFDAESVANEHKDWLHEVKRKVGLNELFPQPYWGFDDLEHKAGTKLLNCFYVQADVKRENGDEFFHFNKVIMLQTFSFDKFLYELEAGNILVDFDARTGHNHGTKFRLRQNCLPKLYKKTTDIL